MTPNNRTLGLGPRPSSLPTFFRMVTLGAWFWGALAGPSAAQAQQRASLAEGARALQKEMVRRGESPGEINLALAAYYAKAKKQAQVGYYVDQARKNGVAGSRTDLLLGSFFRTVGRYDAAFSTLVRVLVAHEGQPFALVELWKTLYESQLTGAEVRTDVASIRERLARAGLYFPEVFQLSDAASE